MTRSFAAANAARARRTAERIAAATPRISPKALYTPGEVAARFGVRVAVVTRWANAGKLPCVRTPGGTRRYRVADVERLIAAGSTKRATP